MFVSVLYKSIQTDKFFEMLQVLTSASLRNKINEGSDATSHFHTVLVDMFFSILMKYHEGTVWTRGSFSWHFIILYRKKIAMGGLEVIFSVTLESIGWEFNCSVSLP